MALSRCFLQDHGPQAAFSPTAPIVRRGWHHDDHVVGNSDETELHCLCRTEELHSRAQLWCLLRGSPRFRGRPFPCPGAPPLSPSAGAVILGSLLSLHILALLDRHPRGPTSELSGPSKAFEITRRHPVSSWGPDV